jgi:ribosomal protein L1
LLFTDITTRVKGISHRRYRNLGSDVGGLKMKEDFLKALEELRKNSKEKPRKFNQSVDLIINLKDFDVRKQSLSLFMRLPHKVKDTKICAFLEKPSKNFDFCITRQQLEGWTNKKEIKNIVKEYDFFVALTGLMPKIATQFGRVLGPAGKMPSPQLGILAAQNEASEKELAEKVHDTVRIKAKEPSIKIAIGKEKMKDEEIAENAAAVYNAVQAALPNGKENVKSVMLKFTMSKPVRAHF